MNFFEQELKKLMTPSTVLQKQRYVGRTCYGTVGKDIRARIEFVSLYSHDKYNSIKITVINRAQGLIDSQIICLGEVLGEKHVADRDISPYIWRWKQDDPYEWYMYKLSDADYAMLMGQIDTYLGIFAEDSQESLTDLDKDAIYRAVWHEHVCEDIVSHLEDMDEELTEEQISYAADRYVYDGEYDCNASYWVNIENVIQLAKDFCKEGRDTNDGSNA